MFWKRKPVLPRLPFPTRSIGLGNTSVAEYIIPDEEKAKVLDGMYPFEPVPDLDRTMFDLHEEKLFKVRDFRVLRGRAMDFLVSPFFFTSGGTVMDWMPPDFKPGEQLSRRIRGSEASIVTVSFGPRETCH